jgi:enediyne biosynthesis protein E4
MMSRASAKSASALLAMGLFLALPGCRNSARPGARFPFVDIAAGAGIDFHHTTGAKGPALNILETTGSGCAILDYDNDGRADLFLVQGREAGQGGHRLYHNLGGGRFEDVTQRAGIKPLGKTFGIGAATGDYDGDGWIDLYVLGWGGNVLYHNNANGTFTDVTGRAGVRGGGFSTGAAFADFDGDGEPDLFVTRYCRFDADSRQLCRQSGIPASCPPYYYDPDSNLYFRNRGNGTFEDGTVTAGVAEKTGRALGLLVFDYDGDGALDVFVANDGSPNFLFKGDGKGHFQEVGAETGVAMGEGGAVLANMGCDLGDIVNDTTQALVVGEFQNQADPLYHFTAAGGVQEIGSAAGLAEPTRKVLTFGLGFADLDNDGWIDLFTANGHVYNRVAEFEPGVTCAQPRQFFRNVGGGKFEDLSAQSGPAVTQPAVGRGLAFGDLDNDGDLDIVVNNNGGPAMVIRNDHPPRHWLRLRLLSRSLQGDAIGATATLYAGDLTHRAIVKTCYSFASASEPFLHFGLGARRRVDRVEIRWPDGEQQTVTGLAVDRVYTIRQRGATPVPRSLAE